MHAWMSTDAGDGAQQSGDAPVMPWTPLAPALEAVLVRRRPKAGRLPRPELRPGRQTGFRKHGHTRSGVDVARHRRVWTWLLDDLAAVASDASEESLSDREYLWANRTYATDVVNRALVPARGSILIGFVRGGGERVLTLGHVDGLTGAATGRVRLMVRPLLHLRPLHVEQLLAVAGGTRRETIFGAESLRPGLLPPGVAAEILASLVQLRPEAKQWLADLSFENVLVHGERGQRLREERDAIQTGVDLSGIPLPESVLRPPVRDVKRATDLLNPAIFEDNEDDLLFADLRRFDRRGVLEEVGASVSRYCDEKFELLIVNVNRKPLEKALGVDLLYWDRLADSYTLLQYKRLERTSGGSTESDDERWWYTRQGELVEQLGRMSGLETRPANSADDWRIVQNPFWFKFVRTDAFDPNDTQVLRGMYIPSEYLRVGIDAGSFRGPRGGFRIGYGNARYVPRSPFVELVRRGYSGSTSAASAEILALIATLSRSGEVVVVSKGRGRGAG